jgi:hypothetical protein
MDGTLTLTLQAPAKNVINFVKPVQPVLSIVVSLAILHSNSNFSIIPVFMNAP